MVFNIGTKVRKKKGYRFPGTVIAAFTTLRGLQRYVVECSVPEVNGILHIYSEKDLEPANAGHRKETTGETLRRCGSERLLSRGITMAFQVGEKVRKISGYRFPGTVVAAFATLRGDRRYVVECSVPEVNGILHIYSEKDLEPANAGHRKEKKT